MPTQIIKETDKYVEYQSGFKESGPIFTRRETKFLCVNGPLQGQKVTDTFIKETSAHYQPHNTLREGPHAGYARYNAASSYRRNKPSCVYVWLEIENA